MVTDLKYFQLRVILSSLRCQSKFMYVYHSSSLDCGLLEYNSFNVSAK